MLPIEIKSTGFLIDERLTAGFKLEANPSSTAISQRIEQLDHAIDIRVAGRWSQINKLVLDLERVLKECWDAQETVSTVRIFSIDDERFDIEDLYRIALAGKKAQITNAERNRIIREIDRILDEREITALEKTYA